MEDEIYINML